MTSFAFMLVDVPAPPWMTPTTNWSWNCAVDDELRRAVDEVGLGGIEDPDLALARAEACLTIASARTRSG